jgi:hypothetical protein
VRVSISAAASGAPPGPSFAGEPLDVGIVCELDDAGQIVRLVEHVSWED